MNKLINKLYKKSNENRYFNYLLYFLENIRSLIVRIMPQKIFLNIKYWRQFHKKINIKNPKTLNEKLQYKNIHDTDKIYTICADKYAVREHIKKKIGEKYLIPLLYHTNKPEEIPFDRLKPPYIIKPNQCSGYTIIVKDNNSLDKKDIIKKTKKWLKINYYDYSKEIHYKYIPPKIIIEKLLLDNKGNTPDDYKLICINGKVEFIMVCTDRFTNCKFSYYDKEWNFLPFKWCKLEDGKPKYDNKEGIPKPENLGEMIKLAEILSKDFDFVRVDFYSINNKIYFGELTFHPGGGSSPFTPEKYDLIYGKKLKLKGFKKKSF